MKTKKQKIYVDSKKITLSNLVWMGFNFVINITFSLTFSIVILDTTSSNSFSIGYQYLWIIALDAFLAFICAWAYLKLGKAHPQGDGSSYIYVRAGFGKYGRFWGFYILMAQYLVLPVTIASNIIALVRKNFISSGSSTAIISGIPTWGGLNYLYFDLMGIAVYLMLSVVIIFGLKILKKFIYVSLYLRWIAVLIIIAFSLYIIIANSGIV